VWRSPDPLDRRGGADLAGARKTARFAERHAARRDNPTPTGAVGLSLSTLASWRVRRVRKPSDGDGDDLDLRPGRGRAWG